MTLVNVLKRIIILFYYTLRDSQTVRPTVDQIVQVLLIISLKLPVEWCKM